jgi:hypothetical protein
MMKIPKSLRLRSAEGRPFDVVVSPAEASSAVEPCPPPLKASGTTRLTISPPSAAATTTNGKGTERK